MSIHHRTWIAPLTASLVAIACLVLTGAPAPAATLLVENNGTDSGACGSKTAPCRSISRAIANAAENDTILVGPGRYGDLDADGTLGETGEESGIGGAAITIGKTVKVLSREGALTTVIDAANNSIPVVSITAPGIVFGAPKHGFTLTKGSTGLTGSDPNGNGASIGGNLAVSNAAVAFQLFTSDNTLTGNVAAGNATGGFASNDTHDTYVGNLSSGNGGDGYILSGSGHVLKGNVAQGNTGSGVTILGSNVTISSLVADGNRGDGIDVGQNLSGIALSAVSMVGNRVGGIFVQINTSVTMVKGNIFANGFVGAQLNCGAGAQTGATLAIANVFWGASTGPGADPADALCSFGALPTADPIAAKPAKVKVKQPKL